MQIFHMGDLMEFVLIDTNQGHNLHLRGPKGAVCCPVKRLCHCQTLKRGYDLNFTYLSTKEYSYPNKRLKI